MQRLAWDRIERRSTVERWAQNLDYERVVPLLALDGTKVVGDATLHYRNAGPLRRVGRIKWLIDPEYRGAGIGTAAITTFIEMARTNGLRRLTCMLVAGLEDDAVTTLKRMGFVEYRIPDYGTDPDGNQVDMLKLVLSL
jgi:GNAT superfamily N-acetyltransferase